MPFCLPGAPDARPSSALPECHPDQGGATDLHHEPTSSAAARRDLLTEQQRTPRLPVAPDKNNNVPPVNLRPHVNLRPPPECHPERSEGSVFSEAESLRRPNSEGRSAFPVLIPFPSPPVSQSVIPTKAALPTFIMNPPYPPPRGGTSSPSNNAPPACPSPRTRTTTSRPSTSGRPSTSARPVCHP